MGQHMKSEAIAYNWRKTKIQIFTYSNTKDVAQQ